MSSSSTFGAEVQEMPEKFDPQGPKVRCDFLPIDFLKCDPLVDLSGNKTEKEDNNGYGCTRVRRFSQNCTVKQ